MSETIVQLRRKNEGKQFTVTDANTRKILHWHRPGEALPFYVWHNHRDYEVTKDDIAQANAKGRIALQPMDDTMEGPNVAYGLNLNGVPVGFPNPTLWQRIKAWAIKQINKLKGVFHAV